jgi:diguanylate cyclase (GGDEF)-like protein/PAS domain S-box-containing protein
MASDVQEFMIGSSVILQFPPSDLGPENEEGRNSVEESTSEIELASKKQSQDEGELAAARVAADLLGIGYWHLKSLEGTISLSPTLKRSLGFLDHEIEGRLSQFLELVHPSDRESIRSLLQEPHGAFSSGVRFVRGDGGYSHFLLKGGPDPAAPENLCGVLVRCDRGTRGQGLEKDLLEEAIEVGIEAMIVLRAARNDRGEPVDFEVVALNSLGAKLLGIHQEEAVGRLLGEIAPETRDEGFCKRYADVMASGQILEQEFHAAPGGFQQIWVRQRVIPLSDGVAVFAEDVSETKRQADSAGRSKRMFERITASTPDLHAVWDIETRRFVYSNRNFFEILGYETDPHGLVQISLVERIVHPEDRARLQEHLRSVSNRADDDVEDAQFRFRAADGAFRWLLFRDSVFERHLNGRAKTVLSTVQDISRQKAYEAELESRMGELHVAREELETRQRELEELNQRLGNLALTDGLTGLKNHRAFQERLSEEVERAQRYNLRLALVMADVDHFKDYNDRYGHPAGDQALKGFAKVLIEVSRSSDMVVRYGGEEFAMILPNTGAEEAAHVAERVRATLKPSEFGSQGVTASFGCAELTPGRDAKERLMRDADRALYESKNAGRDQVTISRIESI